MSQRRSIASAIQDSRDSQKRRKLWVGGEVAPEEQADDVRGAVYKHYDTSGDTGVPEYEETEGFQHLASGGLVEPEEDDDERKPPRLDPAGVASLKRAFMHAGGLAEEREEENFEELPEMHAGGLAKEREKKRFERAAGMLAGGVAKEREAEHNEPTVSMHAGGRADIPEEKDDQVEDPGFDESFVEEVLRRRRKGMSSGGYCR